MDTAPNFKPEGGWATTTQSTFNSPKALHNPIWRGRDPNLKFDDQSSPLDKPKKGGNRFNSSGFTMNSTLFDGTGWKTEANMHGD